MRKAQTKTGQGQARLKYLSQAPMTSYIIPGDRSHTLTRRSVEHWTRALTALG